MLPLRMMEETMTGIEHYDCIKNAAGMLAV